MIAVAGCTSRDEQSTPVKDVTEKLVVVVLPHENGLKSHWERTFSLFERNLARAFRDRDEEVRLRIEFHDENSEDIYELALELSSRSDVYAVVGGLYSSSAATLASVLCRSGVTFFTLSTCEELVRAYSSDGNLWAMTETDITQCEVLLSKVVNYGGSSVALIAESDDLYGSTFVDWFAFQAKELGLEIKGVYDYAGGDVTPAASSAATCGADYVICAPTSISDIKVVIDSFNATTDAPRLLFSDMGYGVDVLSMLGKDAEGIEGVCFGADPESGYDIAFRTYFDTDATVGSAQAYDALMLIAYAAWYQKFNPSSSLKQALRCIVDGRDFNMGSWMGEDMKVVIDALEKGGSPYVRGASGSLDFDSKVYTNVLATVYSNYKVYNGCYIVLDYNTADGGNRTEATLAGWNWKAQQGQHFDDSSDLDYVPRTGNRALLIAASTGWENYRHQADVLAMYNLLKEYGYTDDDIILIMEDDIAYNPSNPEPGVVRVGQSGLNLYNDVHVDYRLSSLTSDDFAAIVQGVASDRLPDVIDSSEGDNILVFWSGHGEPGAMVWNEEKEGMTGDKLHAALSGMTSYRRMAMFVETCFSGSVFEGREWPKGMLFVTAANADETSKADIFNSAANIWMSNRFTSTLREQITANPDIMLRDLYYRLFINTVGSHVMVYNAPLFGNLYTTSMTEFLRMN